LRGDPAFSRWLASLQHPVAAVLVSPTHPELQGAARLAAEAPRQIAMANTAFNLLNALVFLPVAGTLADLARRLVPDRPADDEAWSRPRFLDPSLHTTPPMALDAVRRELGRLAGCVARMLERCEEARQARSPRLLREISVDEMRVDELHAAILAYLSGLSREALDAAQARRVQALVQASATMELASNMIQSRLEPVAHKILDPSERMSPSTGARLDHLSALVRSAYADMEVAVAFGDGERAHAVAAVAADVERLHDEIVGGLSRHMSGRGTERMSLLRAEMELASLLVTLYTFARTAATLATRSDTGGG
jgi:phosphate:Na+ symporter